MKKYRVLNPRNVPEGQPVCTVGDKQYREGQVVQSTPAKVKRLVAAGILKEVKANG